MYDLTILSIFRDSQSYLDRYASQLESLIKLLPDNRIRFVWLEGDSEDNTYNDLQRLTAYFKSFDVHVNLDKYDTGSPYWPSTDNPIRWKHLTRIWNINLSALLPTHIGVCLESDLIWEAQDMIDIISTVKDGAADVAYPSLFKYNTNIFYDTNGFRRNGQKFRNYSPHIPDYDKAEGDIISVESGGGMVVASGQALTEAQWGDTCRLIFPSHYTKLLNLGVVIYHP